MITIPFLETALKAVRKQYYDDVVDRLNYYYSTLILLFLAILVSAKQYIGNPIQCWVPAQFRGGWEQYAENYCFIQNTYYLPPDKEIPKDVYERDYRKIGYYQWVPIVLAIQGLLFYMPNIVWKMLNWQSGINVKSVLKMATAADAVDEEKRKSTVKSLAKYVQDSLDLQKGIATERGGRSNLDRMFNWKYGRTSNSFLSSLYIFVKFLYMLNVVGQFFLLNEFLGTNYSFWGVQILTDLARGREWQDSGHFPRVTLCDFSVRELGNIHRHTIQCVLMINMFNEKIYIFLWLWMFFVAVCTGLNLLYWLFVCLPKRNRDKLIHKYLRISADMTDAAGDRRICEKFSSKYLKPDGVLLIRFIASHAGDMVASDLTYKLFEDYFDKMQEMRQRLNEKQQMSSSVGTANHVGHDNGFNELLYDVEKDGQDLLDHSPSAPKKTDHSNGTLKMATNGYPGPPPTLPPKQKMVSV